VETNKKFNKIGQFSLIVLLSNALFKYFLPNSITKIFPFFALFLALATNTKLRILKDRRDLWFIFFIGIWFIGAIYSPNMQGGFAEVAYLTIIYSTIVLLERTPINNDKIIKYIMVCLIVIVGFIILELFNPSFVLSIAEKFVRSEGFSLVEMKAWMRNGWYTGLFSDRAPAAFFSSVLIGTGLFYFFGSKIYEKKSKYIFGVFLSLVGLWGLLLTGKRGILLATLGAFLMWFLTYKRRDRNFVIKVIFLVFVLYVLIFIAGQKIEIIANLLERFKDNDNLLTGRNVIYSNMLEQIGKTPILGSGTSSAGSILGVGGHNIYLTVLMENGIIGITIFCVVIIGEYVSTVNNLSLMLKYEKYDSTISFSLYIQTVFLIYGMSGNPLYDNYILCFYMFAIYLNRQFDKEKVWMKYHEKQRECG